MIQNDSLSNIDYTNRRLFGIQKQLKMLKTIKTRCINTALYNKHSHKAENHNLRHRWLHYQCVNRCVVKMFACKLECPGIPDPLPPSLRPLLHYSLLQKINKKSSLRDSHPIFGFQQSEYFNYDVL